ERRARSPRAIRLWRGDARTRAPSLSLADRGAGLEPEYVINGDALARLDPLDDFEALLAAVSDLHGAKICFSFLADDDFRSVENRSAKRRRGQRENAVSVARDDGDAAVRADGSLERLGLESDANVAESGRRIERARTDAHRSVQGRLRSDEQD